MNKFAGLNKGLCKEYVDFDGHTALWQGKKQAMAPVLANASADLMLLPLRERAMKAHVFRRSLLGMLSILLCNEFSFNGLF